MEPKIRRRFKSVPITLSTTTAVATTLRWDDIAGGALSMGTVSTNASTTLQIWASDSPTGEFYRLRKVDGSAADLTISPSTVNGAIYALPDETYGCGAIKVVSATTNSTSAVCVVMLKT
jgi:hypothetical protein